MPPKDPVNPSTNGSGSKPDEAETSEMAAVPPEQPVVWPDDPWVSEGSASEPEGGASKPEPHVTSPVIPSWPEAFGEPAIPSHKHPDAEVGDNLDTAQFATTPAVPAWPEKPQDASGSVGKTQPPEPRSTDTAKTQPPTPKTLPNLEAAEPAAEVEVEEPTEPPVLEVAQGSESGAEEPIEPAVVSEPTEPEPAEPEAVAAEPAEIEAQAEPAPVAEPQPEPLPEQLPVEAEPVAAEAPPAEEMPAAAVATPEPEAASEPAEPEVEEPAAAQPVAPQPSPAQPGLDWPKNPPVPTWAPKIPVGGAVPAVEAVERPSNVPSWAPQATSHGWSSGVHSSSPAWGTKPGDAPPAPAPASAPAPAPAPPRPARAAAPAPVPAPLPVQPAQPATPAPTKPAWEIVQQEQAAEPAYGGPSAEDRSYAEWFAWAKRSGAPAQACHAAAQGAFRALAAGQDMNTAVQWATLAMASPPGLVGANRQLYCAWFSLGNIDLKLPTPQAHAFATGAVRALDSGADSMVAHQAGLQAAGITG